MTFEQAVSFALDMAQRRQRVAYIVEFAEGWGVLSYRPRRGQIVAVEPPALDPDEGGEEE